MSETPARKSAGGRGRLLGFLLDVVFPPVCAGCGRVGSILCANCETRMAHVPEPICASCGRFKDMAIAQAVVELCHDCRADPPSLTQMRAALRYEEPTISIIHRMKYEGYFALAEPLARILAGGWPVWSTPPELVVPIPLHPRRRRQRGFNQSELLARSLAQAKGIAVNSAALQRTRNTVPQVGLGPEERKSNVQGAFSAEPESVRDRHVLLVDDVLTTGATMSAAAGALLAAGASRVSAYCLARVN